MSNTTLNRHLSWTDIALAALAGITLPLALAPWIYYGYFQALGWPVFSITHDGPLFALPLGDQICWGNVVMLTVLPIISLVLAARSKHRKLVYLAVAMTLIQFTLGLLNFVPLLFLLD